MTSKKRKYNSLQKTETRDAWIMMAPAIIILLVIAVYPILRTFLAKSPTKWYLQIRGVVIRLWG